MVVLAAPALAIYQIHDGTAENSIGLTGTTEVSFLWGTNFTAAAGEEVITSIDISFGTAATTNFIGNPVTVFLMRANLDGTPMQGGLLTSVGGTITSNNTFINFDITDTVLLVGDRFMVGAVHFRAGATPMFPAAIDQTAPVNGRNYAAFLPSATIDPNNIEAVPAANRNFIENFGLPGNWLITANASPVPEPGTFVAIGLGLAGLALARRRK